VPHCILEYSDNLPDAPDLRALLNRVHRSLLASGEFTRETLKSRAYEAGSHAVADDEDPERGFVALEVNILEGRDDATKAALADGLLAILVEAYPASVKLGKVDISVRIADFHRASYRKQAMTDL
jgi:5-carboxymethyl-2-hydroxymuconate isomerase